MTKTTVTEEPIMYHDVPAVRVTYVDDSGSTYKSIAVYVDGCAYCDGERAAGQTFFPSHFASSGCQSGKHNHCTCDGCF